MNTLTDWLEAAFALILITVAGGYLLWHGIIKRAVK